jgi:hypothetical protein
LYGFPAGALARRGFSLPYLLNWRSFNAGFGGNVFADKVVGDAFRKGREYIVPLAVAGPKDSSPWWRFLAGDDLAVMKNYHISIKPYLNFCLEASVATMLCVWQ